MATRSIRVFDIETTGMDPAMDGVCEIAAVDVVKQEDGKLEVQRAGSWLVHPGRSIPPEARAIHHIGDADVMNARSLPELADLFMPREDCVAVAAHNWGFDGQWLSPLLPLDLFRICTYKAALRVWPAAPAHSNQVLRYWLGIEVDPPGAPHRALYDAIVTAHVLVRLLEVETPGRLSGWTKEPALHPVCKIGKFRGVPWPEVETGFLQWVLGKGADFDSDTRWNVEQELERRALERTPQAAGAEQ